MIDCNHKLYENNSFSTKRSELDKVSHVWFNLTFKNKSYADEKLPAYFSHDLVNAGNRLQ